MARWEKIGPEDRRYAGWYRKHPNIHMFKNEPAAKTSLVQAHRDGSRYTVLAQTTAHGVFTQPPGTKGTTLFKQVSIFKTQKAAMNAVRKFKQHLAQRYDKLTSHSARGLKRL